MKIRDMTITAIVGVTFFILGLVLIGDGLLQQQYGVSEPPEFKEVNDLSGSLETLQSDMETDTFTQEADVGQMDEDESSLSDMGFWAYTRKSLKSLGKAVKLNNPMQSASMEILNYLKVHPLIIAAIIMVLIVSLAFSLISWWKNRVP